MALDDAYVRRTYRRFARLYWPGIELPDWDELDFRFAEYPDEFAHVEWDEAGAHLTIHPICAEYRGVLHETLLHEMVHLAIGSRYGHGPRFRAEVQRIMSLGAWREFFL